MICANAAGLCSTDERVSEYVNRATERLLYKGKWKGTYAHLRVCLNQSCIVWPREIETIESFALCGVPGTVRNEWYEFLDSGPGILNEDSCNGNQLIDKGETCAFDEVAGTDKKLAVYSDVSESANARIILQFYDANAQFVRSQFNGAWIDGESIALPAKGAYAYTTAFCAAGGLVRVIKPVTNGTIRLYEYNNTTAALKPLAYYQPSETRPAYRRSLIPNLVNASTGDADCEYHAVEVVGKLRLVDVANENDYLMISHREAMRLAVKAIKEEESDRWNEAAINWAAAVQCLREQLNHYQGDGAVMPIKMEGSETTGPAVMNII